MELEHIFRKDNDILADKLNRLVHKTVDRALELVEDSESIQELGSAIKVAETAGKITGIVEDKQQINMQINQISGFTFIEINKEDTVQEYITENTKSLN
jgi:hypothetical protein